MSTLIVYNINDAAVVHTQTDATNMPVSLQMLAPVVFRLGLAENDYAAKITKETYVNIKSFLKTNTINTTGVIVAKQPMPLTIDTTSPVFTAGEAVVALSNVPVGTEIFIDDVSVGTATEGEVELAFDLVGTYKLKLVLYPYLDWEETINAN
jgi:hypothetical protein